jgi:hypothetical protein
MASKEEPTKQQRVLEELHKSGTLKKNTTIHISEEKDNESDSQCISNSVQVSPSKRFVPQNDRLILLSDGTQIIVESANEFV